MSVYSTFHLIHLLGAIAMGFYAIVPFIVRELDKLTLAGQGGLLIGLGTANRVSQYLLLIQFLTGGYLMSQSKYSVLWMVLTTIILLAIAAYSGMMSKQIRLARQAVHNGQANAAATRKIHTFSLLIFLLFIAMVVLMVYRY